MDFIEGRTCSFCGEPGSRERRLASGLGAMICSECAAVHHAALSRPPEEGADRPPVWEAMSDTDLLAVLPLIVRTAEQAGGLTREWVGVLRERGLSWAAIGGALGVSRQAAWERFAKRAG